MTAQNSQMTAIQFESGAGWTGLYFTETARDQLVANPGGGQANATMLPCMFNRVVTVTNPGDSVRLPPALPGADIMVLNVGANPMAVFGSGTDQIDGAGSGNSVTHQSNSVVLYSCYSLTTGWSSEGLATGFAASGLQTLSTAGAITAHAGGGQASAFPLTSMQNNVATVVTAGDSVLLPPAVVGLQIVVQNSGGASMNVFPSSQAQGGVSGGDKINALAQNAAFAIASGSTTPTVFYCFATGIWNTK
jgi:hypothetical protein